MLRTLCKSKIHGATVTEANVHYTGSVTLDAHLMKAADLVPYEQVHVVDVDNGARIVTYCIEGPAGSGTVCINGAAARLIAQGDRVIIISYAQLTPAELEAFAPQVVLLDARNAVREIITPPPISSPKADLRVAEIGPMGRELGGGVTPATPLTEDSAFDPFRS